MGFLFLVVLVVCVCPYECVADIDLATITDRAVWRMQLRKSLQVVFCFLVYWIQSIPLENITVYLNLFDGLWKFCLQILDTNPQLFFPLQQQRLIELIRNGKVKEALEFARKS
ncbi:putative CTLH/CRA to LisH motif domain-containing protein [Rosa chinensis]|uniref:Putative CTLH/CRA to LisH motif domain-containing protein n=1 Tax=Rosa chinensis TaxID=74649 RepID=A0A2P6Q3U9_ROSCH|nr:putative CTLH/CRA to LisH motif domain-containing protein [Rosa chinensis]